MLDGLRVMLVDDDAETRELLMAILTRGGAEVKACASAAEALEAIKQWRPFSSYLILGCRTKMVIALIRKLRALEPELGGRHSCCGADRVCRIEDRMRALAAGFQMHANRSDAGSRPASCGA